MRRMASRFSLIVSPMVTPVKMLGLQIAVYRRTIRCLAPAAVHITAVAHDPCYARRLQLPATRDETNARDRTFFCSLYFVISMLAPSSHSITGRWSTTVQPARSNSFSLCSPSIQLNPIAVEEHVHKTINGLEQRKATMRTSLSFDRKHAPCTQDNSTKASITPTSENSTRTTRTMAGASTELWRVLEKRRVRLRLTAPPSPPHYAACSPIGCN